MENKKSKIKSQKTLSAKRKWNRDDTELGLLGLPTFIWYVLFCYLPMFGIIIAFKNYSLKRGHGFIYSLIKSKFVGFDNFKFFFQSNDFLMLLRNTLCYNIVFILLGILLPVTLAILVSQIYSKFQSKVYQTLMFFPHFMSWVVVSYFVYAFLSPDKGLINSILKRLGQNSIQWYLEPKMWPLIIVIMQLWKSTGYGMVIYLASITGIDQTMYEAAVIDGATKWQQAVKITIPTIKPIILMMFILNVGKIFNTDFGLFYQITQRIPAPLYETVSTFDTYIYNALLIGMPIGKNAAASFFQAIACCITILITNAVVKKINPDNAII